MLGKVLDRIRSLLTKGNVSQHFPEAVTPALENLRHVSFSFFLLITGANESLPNRGGNKGMTLDGGGNAPGEVGLKREKTRESGRWRRSDTM